MSYQINIILHSEETARRLVEHSGQRWPGIGRNFRCLMSDDKNTPSAAIWQDRETFHLSYRDFHSRCRDEDGNEVDFLPLGVVWAAIYTGKIRILGKGELPTWSIRLVLDLKLYPGPTFPQGLRKDEPSDPKAAAVWRGALLRYQVQQIYDGGEAFLFTHRFGETWCRMGRNQVAEGLEWLLKEGWLKKLPAPHGSNLKYLYSFGATAFFDGKSA